MGFFRVVLTAVRRRSHKFASPAQNSIVCLTSAGAIKPTSPSSDSNDLHLQKNSEKGNVSVCLAIALRASGALSPESKNGGLDTI